MRIALFTEVFSPKVDGITNTLRYTLEQLRANGDEVLVFAPDTAVEKYLGYRVVRVKGIRFAPYPELNFTLPSFRIFTELLRFKPDVVHVVGPAVLGVWGTLMTRLLRLPLVLSFHTDFPKYMPHYKLQFWVPFTWPALRLVHNLAHFNLCPSHHTRTILMKKGIQNVKVWKGGVDGEAFHPKYRSEEFRHSLGATDPQTLIALYVGRLSWEKDIDHIKRISDRFPNVLTVLVGDGPSREHLKQFFSNSRCVFTGCLSGKTLATAYASADFFVMPSQTETFGLVTLEAMSSGIPVMAANAGGTTDLIRHNENGLLYDPKNSDSMLAAAKALIDSPALRQRLAGKARVYSQQLSWEPTIRELRSFYSEAIHAALEVGVRPSWISLPAVSRPTA